MIHNCFHLFLLLIAFASCTTFLSALEVPSAPFVDLTVLGSDLIAVNFSAPLSDGGAAISSYKVEWDTDPGIHEVQTITTSTYTGPNEIQSITLSALDINEIQHLRTYSGNIREVQRVTVVAATSGYFFLELDTSVLGGSLQYSGYIETGAIASGSSVGADVASLINSMTNIKPFGQVSVTKTTFGSEERYFVTFPESMGDVPEMMVHATQLLPLGTAYATVTTDTIGNVVSGNFRLEFESQITGDIPSDATADEVKSQLEALSTIGSVIVTRSIISNQHGYDWAIEFNSPLNDGNVPMIIVHYDKMRFSNPTSYVVMNMTARDGNEIGGLFSVGFSRTGPQGLISGVTALMSYQATADEFKEKLEQMQDVLGNQLFPNSVTPTNGVVPTAAISVSRTGPDGQKGYSWTVTFLSDYFRTFEGDLNPFTVPGTVNGVFDILNGGQIAGNTVTATVKEERKGTIKEVQLIKTESVNTTMISGSYFMKLQYGDQWTQPIRLRPDDLTCNSTKPEVQTIETSTKDSTAFGNGDDEISMYLSFRLKYGNEVTNWIPARPAFSDITCDTTSALIATELQKFDVFETVYVNGTQLNKNTHTCKWTVSLFSAVGDVNQLQVQAYNTFSNSTGAYGTSSIAGDDTVSLATTKNGSMDAIEEALELLSNVGQVTVTPVSRDQDSLGGCQWRVTFDTNAGDLDLMKVSLIAGSGENSTYQGPPASITTLFNYVKAEVTEIQSGTSTPVSGNFALTFRGARSMYLPYDATAQQVEETLEIMETIGNVAVTRTPADENCGYTWSVTFLTEIGILDFIEFDGRDMAGTAVTGTIAKAMPGVSPPFNSLDHVNNLPLGSIIITDLTKLFVSLGSLDEGIAYYIRVAAINSVGQGPFAFSSTPYAIPHSQRPGKPVDPSLSVVDGKSLGVQFNPPIVDGGEAITFYKVEYANKAFKQEIQELSESCTITKEVQVISTQTDNTRPEVQLLYFTSGFAGGAQVTEQQTVKCDATGGSFRLMFAGYKTAPIAATANCGEIKAALEEVEIINQVTCTMVALGGPMPTQACNSRSVYTGGFRIEFNDVEGMSGDLPVMAYTTNGLTGARFIDVLETRKGNAEISGSFRLSFRGYMTEDIVVDMTGDKTAIAGVIRDALNNLDTIPSNGVTVTYELAAVRSYIFRVTFSHNDLRGDVESLVFVDLFNKLSGSSPKVQIFTDGLDLPNSHGSSANSVRGNEVSGDFTVTYRGHTTARIEFNAAETVVKARLEELPNIGTVEVHRTGPNVLKEYTWAVTFLAMPGAYPYGTEDVSIMTLNFARDVNVNPPTGLAGFSSIAQIATLVTGSSPTVGLWSVSVTNTIHNAAVTRVASGIPATVSASELADILNQLDNIGTVSVSRSNTVTGFKWLVTFDGCSIKNGIDVCNDGDMPLMTVDSTQLACPISVNQTREGSGPSICPGSASGLCVDLVTDLSGVAPYNYILSQLSAGSQYYVRVSAHNSKGFGYPAVTIPEYQVPSDAPPTVAPTGPPSKSELDVLRDTISAQQASIDLIKEQMLSRRKAIEKLQRQMARKTKDIDELRENIAKLRQKVKRSKG